MVVGLSTSWLGLVLSSLFGTAFDGPSIPHARTEPFALLISRTGPDSHGLTPQNVPICARGTYYGPYGRPLQHVYGLDEECLSVAFRTLDSGAVSLPLHGGSSVTVTEKRVLVWLQDAGVDATLRGRHSFDEDMNTLEQNAKAYRIPLRTVEQVVLPVDEDILSFVYRSQSSAIVSVHEAVAAHLDKLLPPFVASIALPAEPTSFIPIPEKATDRINKVLHNLRFNPDIAAILSTLSVDGMRVNVRHLTGEDPYRAGAYIMSRHSFSQGARDAADWIQRQIELSGAKCKQEYFLEGYAPNVICRYPSPKNFVPSSAKNNSLVLLSAHYDSRGSFGSTRAPGANDDGSGVVSILAIARAISEHHIHFTKHEVELVVFAGEEQGLRGSNAYARLLREEGKDVALMVQADMLAYHSPGEPLQLGFPDLIGSPEAAHLLSNVSKIYSPELTVGVTPACCSDHQSFHQQGYPATQVYERAGPIVDPMYHNSGDLSDRRGYDLQQVRAITKVTLGALLEFAGFVLDH